MKLTNTVISTIIFILLLTFAEMANISEKKKVHTRMKLSRNSRSNAKAREIATIVVVSIKFVSYFLKGYIDSKIINEYKSLKKHLEVADEKAQNTQLFLNKYNGEKCTFYNRFGILHKSTHFFFMLQKMKQSVQHFSTQIDTENSFLNKSGSSSFLQVFSNYKKKKNLFIKKFKNTKSNLNKSKKSYSRVKAEKILQEKLQKLQQLLLKQSPAYQQNLKKALNSIEEGLTKIQQKTEQLISLYCSPHIKGLSDDINSIRETLKKEIDDVSDKMNEHLKESNFFTNSLQVGLFTAIKTKFTKSDKKDAKKPAHREEDEDGVEKLDQIVGKMDTVVSELAGDYTKIPAETLFEGNQFLEGYKDLSIGDVSDILDGKKVDKFPNLTKGLLEQNLTKGEMDLHKTSNFFDKTGNTLGDMGAFTGLVLSAKAYFKKPKKDADDIEKFKRKMEIFNGVFGAATHVLGRLGDLVPVLNYASALQSVAELVVKYLEYKNVMQYVIKKIGFVNNLTTQVRMKTLKFMANEVHNRCDLLMNSYDILNKNKENFNMIFSDPKATDFESYFTLKKKIAQYQKANQTPSEGFKTQLEEFNQIESTFGEVLDSNSIMTTSASDLVTINLAYLFDSKNFENLKNNKALKMKSTYGPFNKLLVATSPEQYKSLLEVGYEIIFHLDPSAEKSIDLSKFNFLMGCRGCGDHVVSSIFKFPFEKFNSEKEKIIKAVSLGDPDAKINYLTYDKNVIIYSTYKKGLERFLNPLSKDEKCFHEIPLNKKVFKSFVNFHKTPEEQAADQKSNTAFDNYPESINSFSNIFCQDYTYAHDFISMVNQNNVSREVFHDENEKGNFNLMSKLGNHEQYVLTYEINKFVKGSDDYENDFIQNHSDIMKKTKEEKILISCSKRKDHSVCYYLKPFSENILRRKIQIVSIYKENYSYTNFIFEKKFNFYGKTIIPITNFFDLELRRKSAFGNNEKHRKEFYEIFNLDEHTDIIEIKYTQENDNEEYFDHFLIYEKEKVINSLSNRKTQMASNSNDTGSQAKNFLESIDILKNNICQDRLCQNFFSDGNKRDRYVELAREFDIYNSFYNDSANQLNDLSGLSQNELNEDFSRVTKTDERQEYRKSFLPEPKPKKEKENFVHYMNGMIRKTYNGYFLDLDQSRLFRTPNNALQFIFRKNKKVIIPPLMKIFGNDHNFLIKAFNALTFNSEKNNKSLQILDVDNFSASFNDKCYEAVRDSYYESPFKNNNRNEKSPQNDLPKISPIFSILFDSYKLDENGNKILPSFDLNQLQLMETNTDLKRICLEENGSLYGHSDLCKLYANNQDFSRLFYTFLSTGQEVKTSANMHRISHDNLKEKTIIPITSHFLKDEFIKGKLFSKCGYFIINIPLLITQKVEKSSKNYYYWHVDFNSLKNTENNKISYESQFEFYISEKPGFNDLAFIQIIFNATPKEKMNTYIEYNDSIASLFGYSYVKNKKSNEIKTGNAFDESDFDEYSFPILDKNQKKKLNISDTVLKARIVKSRDLVTSYKREDICGKENE